MTIRIKNQLDGIQPGQTNYFGGFAFNGSSDPATTYGNEKSWFSVARSASGVWTVTLDVPMSSFVAIVATLGLDPDNADAHQLLIGDRSDSSKTFDLVHVTSADTSTTDVAKADIPAAANQDCFFHVVVSDSGVPGSE